MTSSPENKITRSDLIKSAVNTGALGMEFSWTYYKQMNIAFCLMVANMLKKIYAGRPDDYAEALHRHCAFFNITVQFAPFVGGIAMAMEEKVARGEIEPESVNDVKAALMGPLSGIGDSIFLSTLRVVAAAVGISLCQAGNPFGPIAFLLIYNVPGFALRIWGAVKGYELGVGFLDEAQRTGLMFPWMFEQMPELKPFKPAMDLLMEDTSWDKIYDPQRLACNEVPLQAAVYFDDMYVDSGMQLDTLSRVGNSHAWVTNEFEHDGLHGSVVFKHLFDEALNRGDLRRIF